MGRKGARKPIGPQVGIGPPPGLEQSADRNRVENDDCSPDQEWWRKLEDDDPITLEPLAHLDIPPFGLKSASAMHYFDAVALASYITRRAVFENPLNRAPLSREECVRLDEHIAVHAPHSRSFRVADALDLQRAIRAKWASASDGSRSAARLRQDAADTLNGLFDLPSYGRGSEARASARGGGGWTVVDDDFRRHIEAEAIAALHAAASEEAARPGGPAPERTSVSEFPQLTLEATSASERWSAAVAESDGYVRAAEALADEAAREERRRKAEEEARQAAAKEARERAEELKKAAKKQMLELQKHREALRVEAEARAAERRKAFTARRHAEQEEALRVTVEEAAAQRKEENIRAALTREKEQAEQQAQAAEDQAAAERQREEDDRRAAEKKKEKEAEKKQRQKEKKKLQKEKAAAEQAKIELEAAKAASAVKCGMCGQGIVGKNFFEVMDSKFCSTACVQKKRAGG
eukprot:TRINITY_DN73217_c0_g1_i1.p1 TRINITY_DN73217_c0_g1~~TRINITY_DN73217_c0_g1_i1.p1  ORF type:complete len:466 (+),score=124.11 TRINITY_DN73217_c0_g1_i1:70-1467(+)